MIARVKSKKSAAPAKFNVPALRAALDAERSSRGLSWKDVAAEAGISASTLTRLSQGKRPDVDSLAALTHWMDMSADSFMPTRVRGYGGASAMTKISSILRDDPDLDADGASALEEIIKASYGRFRKQK